MDCMPNPLRLNLGPNSIDGCSTITHTPVANITTTLYIWLYWISYAAHGVFILLAPLRMAYLLPLSRVEVANGRAFNIVLAAKVFAGLMIISLRLGLLIVVAAARNDREHASLRAVLATSGPEIVAACLLLAVSVLDHVKRFRPPILSCLFLLVRCICDVIRVPAVRRAATSSDWDAAQGFKSGAAAADIFSGIVLFELLFLGLESTGRRRWIRWRDKTTGQVTSWRDHSPEEVSSILSLASYSWLHSLLWRGYHAPLTMDRLYALDQDISAENFHQHEVGRSATSPEPPRDTSSGSGLSIWRIVAWLWRPLGASVLLPVLPRLCLIGFTFGQAFFLQSLLRFLSENARRDTAAPSPAQNGSAAGFALVCGLIYSGIAFSTSVYWYYQERFQSRLRAFLVSAIYRKTTELKLLPTADADAPVTLMSADVERIYTGVRLLHEVWANALQAALAAHLLHRALLPPSPTPGTLLPSLLPSLAPLALVLATLAASLALARRAPRLQAAWMARVQARTAATASVLSALPALRLAGMAAAAAAVLRGEREAEVGVGGAARALTAASASLGQLPQAVAPALAFAFAFGPGQGMEETRAYAALACLTLLTAPMMVARLEDPDLFTIAKI